LAIERARPRWAAGTRLTAVADAAAVNITPAPMTTRPIISQVRLEASALMRLPALNRPSASKMVRRRLQCPVAKMSMGASTAAPSA
jgi:hypothetical protein